MRADMGAIDPLSPRESQAIELLAVGHSNKEIARKLGMSENTVKYHLKNAYRKLVIGRRAQAAHAWFVHTQSSATEAGGNVLAPVRAGARTATAA